MTTSGTTDGGEDGSRASFWREIAALSGAGWRTFVSLGPFVFVYVLLSASMPWIVSVLPVMHPVAVQSQAWILAWIPTLLLAYILYRSFRLLLSVTQSPSRADLGRFLLAVLICLVAICAVQVVGEMLSDPIGRFVRRSLMAVSLSLSLYFRFEPLSYCLGVALVFVVAGTWIAAGAAGQKLAFKDAMHRCKTGLGWTGGRLLLVLAGVPIVWYLLYWGVVSAYNNSGDGDFMYEIHGDQLRRALFAARHMAEALALVLGAAVVARAFAKSEPDRKRDVTGGSPTARQIEPEAEQGVSG